jgi:hypothetical protein
MSEKPAADVCEEDDVEQEPVMEIQLPNKLMYLPTSTKVADLSEWLKTQNPDSFAFFGSKMLSSVPYKATLHDLGISQIKIDFKILPLTGGTEGISNIQSKNNPKSNFDFSESRFGSN